MVPDGGVHYSICWFTDVPLGPLPSHGHQPNPRQLLENRDGQGQEVNLLRHLSGLEMKFLEPQR